MTGELRTIALAFFVLSSEIGRGFGRLQPLAIIQEKPALRRDPELGKK
jgi:hypothetical protein